MATESMRDDRYGFELFWIFLINLKYIQWVWEFYTFFNSFKVFNIPEKNLIINFYFARQTREA